MFEPKEGETSASLTAVIVGFGEVYQLRFLRVYGQSVFGKPECQYLHYPVGVLLVFTPDDAD
jgi:hypothetical protein